MSNHIFISKKINDFKKKINVASDKSISIRSILLASQAVGTSRLSNLLESEDVINTLKAIRKLGINYKKKGRDYLIEGLGINNFDIRKKITINAGNSGTLARLILGLLVKSKFKIRLIGDESLSKRDFSRIIKPLRLFGANIKSNRNSLPIEILGTNFLRPIIYNETIGSAQVKSCIIFCALNTPGTTLINAKSSRNHTEQLLKSLKYPIKVKKIKNIDKISVNGLSQFKSFNYTVPGDISSAAFFIVLTILTKNSEMVIQNVNVNESRIGIIKILNKMGAAIKFKKKKIYKGENIAKILIKSPKRLIGINCPSSLNSSAIDEFLIIFLVAAKAKGISTFKNLSELNKKESPRLDIALEFLKIIGIKVERKKDDIKIYGNPKLKIKKNIHIKKYLKDHRIFMMSCIAALSFGGNWKIDDKDSINTSFPSFINLLKFLGAEIN